MIKTQSREESRFLKRILLDYYNYIRCNPDNLIVRIYGTCV